MAKRVGVFLDVSNLYFCIRKKYDGRKLDFKSLMDFIEPFGDIQQRIAYGAHIDQQASKFIHFLRGLGFNTKYKEPKVFERPGDDGQIITKRKADWDVGMCIDIVNMADRLDLVVLGSADGDLEPLVSWCRQKGIDVVIIACSISSDLKRSATKYVEIPESLLAGATKDDAIEAAG